MQGNHDNMQGNEKHDDTQGNEKHDDMQEEISETNKISEKDDKTGKEVDVGTSKIHPFPAYKKYFKYCTEIANNYKFYCLLCLSSKKTLSAAKNSSANLKKHIEKKHPHYLKDLENEKVEVKMNKKSNSGTLENVAFQMKQGKLDRFGTGSKLITQNGVNKAIMLYVIEELEPLSIVDRCSFIELIKIGLPSHIKIMNRQALTSNLETTYNRMKENLIAHLAKIDFVTTTADLWSKSKRSFLGMTVHWINPESLERESAVIACKRIEGNHTYDVLAKEMNDIHQEYHIHNKITFTVTDNASNFVKSFKIFAKEDEKINNDDETFHSLMDVLSSSRFEHCNDSDFENIENDITLITLPQHMRCACHTLNLIAVHDTEEAMIQYTKKFIKALLLSVQNYDRNKINLHKSQIIFIKSLEYTW